jgi:nucleotide-binding universal stress UspA family protein
MKLLIAYDGSRDADSALDDLGAAGLPVAGEAHVVSIAEVWMPPPGSLDDRNVEPDYVESVLRDCRLKGERAVAEAEMLARFAAGRVKVALPGWNVTWSASYGSPGWEIVDAAEKFEAEIVIVGAQGHSLLSRLVLGSISQRVLTEARCSVRIGRGKIDLDGGPRKILIGFDGSRGSWAAVAAVAKRNWTDGTEVLLVNVIQDLLPTAIGRFVTPVAAATKDINIAERSIVAGSADLAVTKLGSAGLATSFRTCAGNPKQELIEEADRWNADCIFVGANAWGSRLERFLVGSTSAAIAARALCSVEVVRSVAVQSRGQIDEATIGFSALPTEKVRK